MVSMKFDFHGTEFFGVKAKRNYLDTFLRPQLLASLQVKAQIYSVCERKIWLNFLRLKVVPVKRSFLGSGEGRYRRCRSRAFKMYTYDLYEWNEDFPTNISWASKISSLILVRAVRIDDFSLENWRFVCVCTLASVRPCTRMRIGLHNIISSSVEAFAMKFYKYNLYHGIIYFIQFYEEWSNS